MKNSLGVPSCLPLRRHSFSAPASLILDSCLVRTASLHEKLDRLSAKVKIDQETNSEDSSLTKSHSLPASFKVPESLKMPGCGGCHGPCGASQHIGSRKGYVACVLEHYSECPGNINPVPGRVRPCPDGYVPGAVLPACAPDGLVEGIDTDQMSSPESPAEQRLSNLEDATTTEFEESGPENKTQSKIPTSKTVTQLSPSALLFPLGGSSVNFQPPSLFTPPTGLPAIDPTLILQQQLAALMNNQQQLAASHAQEQKQQAVIRQQEKEELAEVQKQLRDVRNSLSVRPKSKTVSFSEEELVSVTNTARDLQSDNSKSKNKSRGTVDLTMDDIRRSGIAEEVENTMQGVYNIPALGGAGLQFNTPGNSSTFSGTDPIQSTLQQQQAFFATQQAAFLRQQQEVMETFKKQQEEFWASAASGRQQQFVPLQSKTQKRSERRLAEEAALQAKAERKAAREERLKKAEAELKDVQKALMKAKRAVQKASGEVVESDTDDEGDLDTTITGKRRLNCSKLDSSTNSDSEAEKTAQVVPKFIVDQKSGQRYRVVGTKVNKAVPVPVGSSTSSSGEDTSREEKKREKKLRKKERQRAAATKSTPVIVPGITPLPPVPSKLQSQSTSLTKQGKSALSAESVKVLSVIDWAKLCPVKYASGLTHKNINLSMFMWGKLAELRAALAGATAPLGPGELNARLRHLQCTLELCNLNSQPADFTSYGWLLAKNYDEKVQSMIDSGTSDWVGHDSTFKTTLHPAFVMSAKDEVPLPVPKKDPKKKSDANGQSSDPAVKKKVCETFNICRTKKKCTYEVENAPARCRRLHECSYCREQRSVREFHQSWDCGHGGRDAAAAADH